MDLDCPSLVNARSALETINPNSTVNRISGASRAALGAPDRSQPAPSLKWILGYNPLGRCLKVGPRSTVWYDT